MNRRKSILLTSIISTILAFLIVFISVAVSISNYGKTNEKQNADVAIVLGAALYKNTVSPVYRERINHAITLYNEGYVNKIILTGGIGEENIYSDALIAMEYARSMGLPKKAILLEENSAITEENIIYSKKIMDENNFKTAIIISDPLHMKRAMLLAKKYDVEAFSSPTPTTMYKTFKTKFPFLLRETFMYIGYSIINIFR